MTQPSSPRPSATNHKLKISPRPRVKNVLFPWLVCGLGGLFYCYEYLLRVSPSVMSQQIMQHFHTNVAGFGVLASSYYYIYAIMQLFVGVLIDSYGPRPSHVFSLCLLCSRRGVIRSHPLLLCCLCRPLYDWFWLSLCFCWGYEISCHLVAATFFCFNFWHYHHPGDVRGVFWVMYY